MIICSVNTQSNSPPNFLFQEVTTGNIAAVQAAVAGGVQAFTQTEGSEGAAGVAMHAILERTVIGGG
jgi:hypothetical protein